MTGWLFGLFRDLVYVEGQLRYSDYTDKEGVQRTKADIYQCKPMHL
jgi:single-stranded DNA-binding protein